MSRLPTPDPGWEESTEGDLDADLTEEAGSGLEDWTESRGSVRATLFRVFGFATLIAILGGVVAQVALAR